ncbi:MAG: hypothetical protein KKD39_05995 [Candidatus Altiarchaeota archaeon]|nr:hypothetical protein [Candidatus Altiarchaeota archaeon]
MNPDNLSADANSNISKNVKWLLQKARLNVIDNWEKRTNTEYNIVQEKRKTIMNMLELKKRQYPELKSRLEYVKSAYGTTLSKKQLIDSRIERVNSMKENVESDIKAVLGSENARLDVDGYLSKFIDDVNSEVDGKRREVNDLTKEVDETSREIKRLEDDFYKNSMTQQNLESRISEIKNARFEVKTELEYLAKAMVEDGETLGEIPRGKIQLQKKLAVLMKEEESEKLESVSDSRLKLEEKLKRLLEEDTKDGGDAR